jgi:O-antigen/teichoic acid export membrane protein
METLRMVGALVVLHFFSPTLEAFFWWQILATFLYAATSAGFLWARLPRAHGSARFSIESLRPVWRFAAGLGGISLTVVLLTQLDKVLLSRLLPLTKFGYYSIASTLSIGFSQLGLPIQTAAYPRFVGLIAEGDDAGLREIYHRSCQMIAAVVLPAMVVTQLFPRQILYLFTHDHVLVENSYQILQLLTLGSCLNVLMLLPYTIQLAHKWTRLAFISNVIAVIVLTPVLYWSTIRWGGLGAAGVWVALNAGYLLINVRLMHRRLLSGELGPWMVDDILKPLAGGLLVPLLVWLILPMDASVPMTFVAIAIAAVGGVVLAGLAAPQTRGRALALVKAR